METIEIMVIKERNNSEQTYCLHVQDAAVLMRTIMKVGEHMHKLFVGIKVPL